MIKEELIIENKRVDLYQNGNINRTLTLNSLGSITNKQSSYSNTIKLPKTANNILIFEGLGIAGNNAEVQYKRLKCDYSYNTISVFKNGYAIINSVTPDNYEITIFNGIIELGEALKGKKLSDLNLSGLTHNYSVEDYQIILNDEDSNIQYSVITDNLQREEEGVAFGNLTSTYNLSETFPFIKSEYIFKEIIEQAGFEIDGDLFEDSIIYNEFKTEYVTLNKGYIINTPQQNLITEISNIGINNFMIDEGIEDAQLLFIDPFTNTYNINNLNGTSTANVTITTSNFTTNYSGLVRLDLNLLYNIRYAEYIKIQLFKNGDLIDELKIIDNSLNNTTYPFQFYTIDGEIYTWKLEAKSERAFKTISVNNPPMFGQWLKFNLGFKYTIKKNETEPIIISDNEIKLGKENQLDFIKDIVNRYGLLLNKSETSNKITTKNINNLLNDREGAIDYSSNLNKIKSESFVNDYAQENHFKYKYSDNPNSEVDNSGFYDDSFDLDNKLATSEKTVFTSIFEVLNENPFTTPYFLNNITNTPTFESHLNLKHNLIAFDEENSTYKPIENKLKLVKLYKSLFKVDYKLYFNDLPPIPVNNYFNNITLPKPFSEVFIQYYSKFIELLEKYKTLKVEFNFNSADIRNFDFYKLIYLKQTGRYYYTNNLKYNVISTKVEAELVELPF